MNVEHSSNPFLDDENRYQQISEHPAQGVNATVFLAADTWRENKRVVVKYTSFREHMKWGENEEELEKRPRGKSTRKLLYLFREVQVLLAADQTNIVKLIHCARPPSNLLQFQELALVFEYHPKRLTDVLKESGPIVLGRRRKYLYEILLGLNYLHSCGIIHRDFKPDNILISAGDEIKICDLGMARGWGVTGQNGSVADATMDICTAYYRAPEIWDGAAKYSSLVDVFAVGVIMAQMMMPNPSDIATIRDEIGRDHPAGLLLTGKFGCGSQYAYSVVVNQQYKYGNIAMPAPPRIHTIGPHNGDLNADYYLNQDLKLVQGAHVAVWHPFYETYAKYAGKPELADMEREGAPPPPPLTKDSPDADLEYDLLKRLMAIDPKQRFTALQALKHPYFHSIAKEKDWKEHMDMSKVQTEYEDWFRRTRPASAIAERRRLRLHYDFIKTLIYNQMVKIHRAGPTYGDLPLHARPLGDAELLPVVVPERTKFVEPVHALDVQAAEAWVAPPALPGTSSSSIPPVAILQPLPENVLTMASQMANPSSVNMDSLINSPQ